MDAFDLDLSESPIVVRSKHQLLSEGNLAVEDHPGENGLTVLLKSLCHIELRELFACLLRVPLVGSVDRQHVQKLKE